MSRVQQASWSWLSQSRFWASSLPRSAIRTGSSGDSTGSVWLEPTYPYGDDDYESIHAMVDGVEDQMESFLYVRPGRYRVQRTVGSRSDWITVGEVVMEAGQKTVFRMPPPPTGGVTIRVAAPDPTKGIRGHVLIAPVSVGRNASIAAGSTITKDVPDESLAVSRNRDQKHVDRWSRRKRPGDKLAE